jgi:hypothetical protein
MGADIYDWERVHGRGSWDGEPYEDRARRLVDAWRAELISGPDPTLRRCTRELAQALGLHSVLAALEEA